MTPYAHPVDPSFYDASDPFGAIAGRVREHRGSDYPCPEGTVIHAPSDGEVVFAEHYGELGNLIGVAFTDGMFSGLAHNSSFIRGVGDKVRLGAPLALSGATGNVSGPHCHMSLGSTRDAIFGSGYGSTLVNPYEYIQAHLGSGTSREEIEMLHFKIKDSNKYVILTADGRRATYTSGDDTFANSLNIGAAAPTELAVVDSIHTQFLASGPAAPLVKVDFTPVVKAIQAGVKSVNAKLSTLVVRK